MNFAHRANSIWSLVHVWLVLDFFGDARRSGSTSGSSLTSTIFSQSFLALVFAALLYPEIAALPFAAANLCLSTLLVAVGSLGDEERPQRRLADQLLLGTAPLGRVAIVLARSSHVMFHVSLVTIGMALPPAILLAHLRHDWLLAPAYVAAACAASGLAVGALATAATIVNRWLDPARAALAIGTGKAVLLGAGVALFAIGLQRLDKDAAGLPIGRVGAELLPPYHLARLLLDPVGESWRALALAAIALVLLGLGLALATSSPPCPAPVSRWQPLRWLLTRISPPGVQLGVADFVATAMWRSSGFRARVLPLLGLPGGMAFLAVDASGAHRFVLLNLLLQLPAIYLPFLIAFLPRADQPGSGWMFAHAPKLTSGDVQDATWRALVTHVLVPVHGLVFLLLMALGPDRTDLAAAAVFAAALGTLVARRMARDVGAVPFTATREQDGAIDLGGLLGFAFALLAAATCYAAVLPAWLRWPVAAAVLTVALLAVNRPRRAAGPAAAPPAEELAEPASEPMDTAGAGPTPPRARRPASVQRELRAILVLFGALSVLPWAIGAALAP